jgi:kynurenine 3-monooxygenase
MKEKKAIVVGAGLVGSLWAVLLAKKGYSVEVYERRPDMRRAGFKGGRSINLAMSLRGWKAMELAGVKDRIEADALPMRGRMMHSVKGDLTFQPYGKEGQAIYSVSRGGLNLELLNIAAETGKVSFHFNQACRKVDVENNRLYFQDQESGVETIAESPLIFGTDGAFSAIRGSLQKTPRFNYSQQYLEHGYKELTIPPNADGSHKMETNALHIWPRGQFMLIALPNPDGSFTCTLFLPFEGPESFSNLDTDEAVLAFFNKYFADSVPLIPDLISDFQQNPTSPLVTVRCHPWQYKKRILLLGDASHAIVPFYGQGMNSGFEDCTILYDLIERFDEDWPTIIEYFNKHRPKDANAIADLALRNFVEMRDLVADPKFLLRKKIAARLHEKYPDFIPLYSMVTFSEIPYSEALAEGHAQDELFEEILALENIEERWDSQEVDQVFETWVSKK